MNEKQRTRTSKFLSLVLRHQPGSARIELDDAGWVRVDELLAGCAGVGRRWTRDQLNHVVSTNAKKRFEFSPDGQRIRASQGHSVKVDLQYAPQVPPEILYHGTATRFVESIRAAGLAKMKRHQVHLSDEVKTTMAVGARHGKAVLLTIRAHEMHQAGHVFHLSTNGVWLVDEVPASFIDFPDTLSAP